MRRLLGAIGIAACLAVAVPFGIGDEGAEKTNAAFEKLKALVGEWEGTASFGDGQSNPAGINLRLTAGGSALVETEFPGTDHEMMTVMTLDKGELVLTHYCHLSNQPHMKGKLAGDNEIAFDFAGGANIDPAVDAHMHSAHYKLIDADHFESTWTLFKDGKPAGAAKMVMTRKKPAGK